MKNKQFALLLLAVFGGCTFGTYLAGNMPRANAQIPPGSNVAQEYLIVPEKGLKILSYTNKPIAIIGTEGQGAFMTMYDSQGQPSLVLRARTGTQTSVGDIGPGAGFAVRGANQAGFTAALTGDSAYMGLAMGNSTSNGISVTNQGTSLSLMANTGKPFYEVTTDSTGSVFKLSDTTGSNMFNILKRDSKTLMSLFGTSSSEVTEIAGGGNASAKTATSTLWKLPIE